MPKSSTRSHIPKTHSAFKDLDKDGYNEICMAKTIAERILDFHSFDVPALRLTEGAPHFPGPGVNGVLDGLHWYDPGSDTLSIPDVSDIFDTQS